MSTIVATPAGNRVGLLEKLMAGVRPEFRVELFLPDPADPILGLKTCLVDGCDGVGRRALRRAAGYLGCAGARGGLPGGAGSDEVPSPPASIRAGSQPVVGLATRHPMPYSRRGTRSGQALNGAAPSTTNGPGLKPSLGTGSLHQVASLELLYSSGGAIRYAFKLAPSGITPVSK